MLIELRPMQVNWSGRRLRIATPLDYRGDPEAWRPEHLVLAGIANSVISAFCALAARERVAAACHGIRAAATIEKKEDREPSFVDILLQPEIRVALGQAPSARRVLAEACDVAFLSPSLRSIVRLEPNFEVVAVSLAG